MLRILLGQMEVIPGRPDLNAATMLGMIGEARREARMIVFPALCLSGGYVGDNWEKQSFLRDCQGYGERIIQASEDICVVFGNVAAGDRGQLFDAVFASYRGALLTPDGSPYPFWIRRLDNTRYFTGLDQVAAELGRTPESLQGDAVLPFEGTPSSLGFLTEKGGWPGNERVERENGVAPPSARLLVYLASTPFAAGRGQALEEKLAAEAAGRGVPLIYVNNTGIQNKGKTVYIFDGGSAAFSGSGERVFRLPSFASETSHQPIVLTDGAGIEVEAAPDTGPEPLSREGSSGEIFGALSYGIKKFLAQTGIRRVVIGASGGIDSAVNAALFGSILEPEQLLLVNMPSRFNSRITRDLAAELAANLGCHYAVMPIQESVDYTIRQIEENATICPAPMTPACFTVSQAVAENIQARDRSARVLAGLAAAFGGGFTCNANKSETTIGYSTMYGDLSGFLAPLADMWKYQVYELADYLNRRVYQREVIPQKSVEIRPSAELSPAQAVEEGKGDPLHYPYHDYLFRAFMENSPRATPEDLLDWYLQEILEEKIGCAPGLVKGLFPGPKEFIADLERWWQLFTGLAVAKRIQSPPILSVSRRAYGADYPEAQNGSYYTERYLALKAAQLSR